MFLGKILERLSSAESCDQERTLDEQLAPLRSPGVLDQETSWTRFRVFASLLIELQTILESGTVALSDVQSDQIVRAFNFFVGYGIRPNLIKSVCRSTQDVAPKEPVSALRQHRQLVYCMRVVENIGAAPQLKQLLISSHFLDILLVYLQLCYAPLMRTTVKTGAVATETTSLEDLLARCDITDGVTVDSVIHEMEQDRRKFLKEFGHLVEAAPQPALIQSLRSIISSKNPQWLKREAGKLLSRCLLRRDGLSNFIHAFLGSKDNLASDRIDVFARGIVNSPSFVDEVSYVQNLGSQIATNIQTDTTPFGENKFRLMIAITDSFLSTKPQLSLEHIFQECFKALIDLLRGQGSISSTELIDHLDLVKRSCQNLPRNSALLECFLLFLPIYLQVASFAKNTISVVGSLAGETIGSLLEKTSGSEIHLVRMLDPDSPVKAPRFSMQFTDDGNVEVSADQPESRIPLEKTAAALKSIMIDNTTAPSFYLELMERFNGFRDSSGEGTDDEFRILVAALLEDIPPSVEDHIQRNPRHGAALVLMRLKQLRGGQPSSLRGPCHGEEIAILLGITEALIVHRNISAVNLKNLALEIQTLKVDEDMAGRVEEIKDNLTQRLDELSEATETADAEICDLRIAAMASRILLGVDWESQRPLPDEEDLMPTLEELVDRQVYKKSREVERTIYGQLSPYKRVKIDLLDTSIPTRGHGFVQLRKLLHSRDKATLEDLDEIFEICREGMEDDDSYIYLGAIQCFVILVEIDTETYLPFLTTIVDQCKDNRVAVLLCECLARCIPSFGDMMPVYSARLLETLLSLCKHNDDLLRLFGCSLLGDVVGRLRSVAHSFRQILNVLLAMVVSDESIIVKRGAAQGLADIVQNTDKSVLATEYAAEVRDLRRSIKIVAEKNDDQPMAVHLERILRNLDELARFLLDAAARSS